MPFCFRIVAQNSIGVSEPSDTVTIETAEEAPSGPPVDIRVAAVDQHTLRVSWKPPLTEHWNGDRSKQPYNHLLQEIQMPQAYVVK